MWQLCVQTCYVDVVTIIVYLSCTMVILLCQCFHYYLGRCFAALGDVAKAHYLRETHQLAKQKESETVSVLQPH